MFQAKRFDAFIALDRNAAEDAIKKEGFTDYDYANYSYIRHIGNYFGISKNHPARPELQETL